MNAFQLVQLVQSRIPGYSQAEYLREVNDAYRQVCDEIIKLDEDYFTDIQRLTVVGTDVNNASADFDLVANSFLSLSGQQFQNTYFTSQAAFAGTVANDTTTLGGSAWTNPQNAQGAPDQQYATNANAVTALLKSTNCGFTVPSQATMTGIRLDAVMHYSSVPAQLANANCFYKNGGAFAVGTSKLGFTGGPSNQYPTGFDFVATWGGSNDLGIGEFPPTPASFSPADINNSGFGVGIQFTSSGGTYSVDSIKLTVYFTLPRSSLHPLLYQIKRIRVLQPGDSTWNTAEETDLNNPDFLADQQQQPQSPGTVAPYRYYLSNRNFIKFSRPLPNNSTIEITYTYDRPDLNILTAGNISAGDTVNYTGNQTTFTQIVSPALQLLLPTASSTIPQLSLQSEIGFGATPAQFFQVSQYNSDTGLNISSGPVISGSGSSYVLANVPDVPSAHHRVIADIATKNFLSTPGDDPRFAEWDRISTANVEKMKDSMIQRGHQNNPRKGRFPYSVVRRGRYYGAH